MNEVQDAESDWICWATRPWSRIFSDESFEVLLFVHSTGSIGTQEPPIAPVRV